MRTATAYEGYVGVLTGTAPGKSLSVRESSEIQALLPGAISDVNRAMAEEGLKSRYRAALPAK